MARFYGGAHGHRGRATRLGTPSSGMRAFANGWKIGARVEVNDCKGVDVVHVTITSGSNGTANSVALGRFIIGSDGEVRKLEDGEPVPVEEVKASA